ncbi:Cytochrome P450 monooxygenase [Fulvia fulva]|uniref:Cytochrome P450 monooxygenase n=1 Tax=Passalora fulva TaxID=5499 RepID=A0A9Q8PMW5_PASFU|nr:Cytochrome P450 monooxygenase [Fulvia fulva]KAK4609167.1 Cytochrome P450 monooxygenase [Fulvia fulva]KAK4609627.1 Cytochrome P450 monooxygenase [Fulvia fulva]UJO25342.1 Cytochrome P450 monooxygenase [Fulvia fulva]WPV22917.1 Cytochrome P450 monooxygenase [Fulvia fulva]WPV37718.1 Cytochrome P450 monooxygenase [Fulvia fulva]
MLDFMTGTTMSGYLSALPLLLLALYLLYRRSTGHDQLPLPPGPTGLPLIGNLPELLSSVKDGEQHLLFQRWARQFGAVYKVKLGPHTQYMVNTDIAVKQIFDKPAGVSANRPAWLVSSHHMCNDWNVLLINADTPRWKHQRRVTQGNVGSIPRADAGLPFLHYETLKFMHEVVNDSTIRSSGPALWNSIMRYTYSAFSTQMLGFDVPKSTDPAIGYIHGTGIAQILGTLPGAHLVEVLPFLDYLPLFLKPWERAGRERFRRDLAWSVNKLRRMKKASVDGVAVTESLLYKVVEDEKSLGFPSEEEGAYFCLMLTIGAADTSQISTWSFIEAMMEYPEVQEKARHEVDKVVGDRIPEFADYESIPYVRCLVKETWRWRPPVGLGHPHVTTDDIVYDGMRIPKGSHIHLNGYALQHDPARHPQPDNFIPERFEGDMTSVMQSINSSDVQKRDHFAFGAGRRICPGYDVAERSLAVAIMRLLWACEIKPSPDAKLPLNIANWRGDFPGLPGSKMPVMMVPRSDEKVRLINEAFQSANDARQNVEPLDI